LDIPLFPEGTGTSGRLALIPPLMGTWLAKMMNSYTQAKLIRKDF
jgi:hypothetical protein